jgi:hypothetical protein
MQTKWIKKLVGTLDSRHGSHMCKVEDDGG